MRQQKKNSNLEVVSRKQKKFKFKNLKLTEKPEGKEER